MWAKRHMGLIMKYFRDNRSVSILLCVGMVAKCCRRGKKAIEKDESANSFQDIQLPVIGQNRVSLSPEQSVWLMRQSFRILRHEVFDLQI